MNTQTTFRSNNNNKYIQPNRQRNNQVQIPLNLTKKKELKKEFSLEGSINAFPTLSRIDNNNHQTPILSFANATKTEKKEIVNVNVSDTIPGWIHIRKNNGKIEYKEGIPTNRYPFSYDNFDFKLGSAMFKNRLAREQYERDNEIDRLGDLSLYYGEKTLYELFDDEEELMMNENYDDSLSSSEQSDYDDSNDIIANKFENNN
jgi:hypothetical protein